MELQLLLHCLTFVAAMLRQHRREPRATCEHAEAHGNAGKISEGSAMFDEALDVVRHNGEALNEAELWRLKDELLLRVSDGHTERSEDNDPNEETTDLPL